MKEFLKTNVGKTLRTAVYIGISAALGALTAAIANDPNLFGPATAFINIALVYVKQTFFSPDTPNVGK